MSQESDKKTKGKKGKKFSTKESMLSILDQITNVQTETINKKLGNQKARDEFFEKKKQVILKRKEAKLEKLEKMKKELKVGSKRKAKAKGSKPQKKLESETIVKEKKKVRFSD